MATVRVHELAKDMNIPSKDLLEKLQALGLNMKNHMSTIPSGEVSRIKNMVLNLGKGQSQGQGQSSRNVNSADKGPSQGQKAGEVQDRNNGSSNNSRSNQTNNTRNNSTANDRKDLPTGKPQDNRGPQQGGQRPQYGPSGGRQNQRPGAGPQGSQKPGTAQPNRNRPPNPASRPAAPDAEKTLNKAESVVGDRAYERGGKTKTATTKKGPRYDDKKSDFKRGGKYNKNRGSKNRHHRDIAPTTVKQVTLEGSMTLQDFAHLINKKAAEVIKKLLEMGVLATINQELDLDTLVLLGNEFGISVEIKKKKEEILLEEDVPDSPEDMRERPPVVTIMGHVDHGKTSLLDVIRHTNVTATEAGGITQHIGAYQVDVKGRKITFLDTPGHEAFTAMRARGAQVTDIAILVVAADDGVMPQTIEAINHAQAAKVPIIVAVNKIDKENANPDRVKQGLTEYGLVSEEWGGDAIFVEVSAITKQGLENLLEMILLVAEMSDLRSNPNKKARGTVVEAKLDKGRGPVATVLVQDGSLEVGDYIIVGTTQGRVRAMQDDKGRVLKKAPPSTPVELIGLNDVPAAGDVFRVVEDERLAKQIASEREAQKREETSNSRARVSLEDLFSQIQHGEVQDLNIIIKTDVQGSFEAIKQSLEKLSNDEVRVNIIHSGVGAITETDVMLADASNAIIIGFNVRPDVNSRKAAEKQQIDIRLYRVIYNAIEDVKAAMSGLLKPELKEVVLGRAEVRATFKVPKAGTIAGCYILEGKINRNSQVRLIRDGVVVHEGTIDSLKRFKDDVKEVVSGYECGIGIERFNDVHEGDHIEAFTFEEIKREIS